MGDGTARAWEAARVQRALDVPGRRLDPVPGGVPQVTVYAANVNGNGPESEASDPAPVGA